MALSDRIYDRIRDVFTIVKMLYLSLLRRLVSSRESAPLTATVPEVESLGNFFVRIQYVLKIQSLLGGLTLTLARGYAVVFYGGWR